MHAFLQAFIDQEAKRLGMAPADYTLSNQIYVLVNNGSLPATLSSTDTSVRHNMYAGLDGVGNPKPLKPLVFDLERNLLFLYQFNAYFADYESYLQVNSKSRPVRYDHLENAHLFPHIFADEYRLESDLVTLHTGKVEIRASFQQSNICRASLSGVLLKPRK